MSEERIAIANKALAAFASVQIERRPSGWWVTWTKSDGESVERRWMTRGGQDFYPVWSRIYPGGGTSSTALSQLIRWCAGKPVLPLATWQYWAGERVKLLGPEVVEWLRAGGYPEVAKCVLCGNEIHGGMDWWNLHGDSGPCCGWMNGCRQKPQQEPSP